MSVVHLKFFQKKRPKFKRLGWAKNKTIMDSLIKIFFSQLNLQADTDESLVLTDYREVDGGVTEVIYTYEDSTYGTFHMQFTVDGPEGFTTFAYQ